MAATIVGDWLVAEALKDKAQQEVSEVVVLLSSYTYVCEKGGEDSNIQVHRCQSPRTHPCLPSQNAVRNVFLAAQSKLAGHNIALVIETVTIPFPIENTAQLLDAFTSKLETLHEEYAVSQWEAKS